MWKSDDENVVNQASIFKCENGFGIELLTVVGEEALSKRYVAVDLNQAIELVKNYFLKEV